MLSPLFRNIFLSDIWLLLFFYCLQVAQMSPFWWELQWLLYSWFNTPFLQHCMVFITIKQTIIHSSCLLTVYSHQHVNSMRTELFLYVYFVLHCLSQAESSTPSKHSVNFWRMSKFYPNFTELVTETLYNYPVCLMQVNF